MSTFKENIVTILDLDYNKDVKSASTVELYNAVSKAAMKTVSNNWSWDTDKKKVCYLSAEFLMGRMVYNNLLNLGLIDQLNELFAENGIDFTVFEDIEDDALGNGGLGRLAACFIDSAATHNIVLNGYGIRYKYGIFKQYFDNGFQKETADDWTRFGDPWSKRREEDKVLIRFKGQDVWAIPYDSPVIGYGAATINTLRLWQAEPVHPFNFDLFNDQKYDKSFKERNDAEAITSVLYPNDSTDAGKKLRLKQQYFFSSASLQDVVRKYKAKYGNDFSKFSSEYAIQLNDTHPTVSIPELCRILVEEEGLTFNKAFKICKETFAYTNHTIMPEALEKWSVKLFKQVIPNVYKYVVKINNALIKEVKSLGVEDKDINKYQIIDTPYGNDWQVIHMARMAIYTSFSTNGVAQIHTEILKRETLNDWYKLYPERFNNKTNGITQRRWLALANMELAGFINDKVGNGWITNLDELKKLEKFADDKKVIQKYDDIKKIKKKQLADYIKEKEGIDLDPSFIFDIQVKRLHEYKRQLLNAFSILDIYFGLKDGRIKDFNPTAFIFGAKSAPGYLRAKGIIKFINEISKMIDADPDVNDKLKVIFVSNYCVSYAEKIIPDADVSEQLSTAGTEESGSSNMKFMLNGAVTLGTYDGANIEIVEQAGEENNYIFGAKVEEIDEIRDSYRARDYYEKNPRIKRVVDTLIDGTFSDDGLMAEDGKRTIFRELYDSLLDGAAWHNADQYFLFKDFESYVDTKLRVNKDFSDISSFRKKCFYNTANAGKFSSDRTILDYANEVWKA